MRVGLMRLDSVCPTQFRILPRDFGPLVRDECSVVVRRGHAAVLEFRDVVQSCCQFYLKVLSRFSAEAVRCRKSKCRVSVSEGLLKRLVSAVVDQMTLGVEF